MTDQPKQKMDASIDFEGQKDVPQDYQPEQGSPLDVQGEAELRQSYPGNDRVQDKQEAAPAEA